MGLRVESNPLHALLIVYTLGRVPFSSLEHLCSFENSGWRCQLGPESRKGTGKRLSKFVRNRKSQHPSTCISTLLFQEFLERERLVLESYWVLLSNSESPKICIMSALLDSKHGCDESSTAVNVLGPMLTSCSEDNCPCTPYTNETINEKWTCLGSLMRFACKAERTDPQPSWLDNTPFAGRG